MHRELLLDAEADLHSRHDLKFRYTVWYGHAHRYWKVPLV